MRSEIKEYEAVYLLLLKMNGEWKCVAKAYNQNSDTIKK